MPKTNGIRPEVAQAVNEIQAMLSARTSRLDLARRAGLQYNGERDVYKSAGYPDDPTVESFYARWDRQDIAGRIVDLFPKETWRRAPSIVEGDADPEENPTAFMRDVIALDQRLRLANRLERADRLSRIGRYGVILLGTRDMATDRDMANPLEPDSLSGPGDVLYLSVFSEKHAEVNEWVTDRTDERFGRAKNYKIQLSAGVDSFSAGTVVADASRVIHIAEDLLEDEVYGRPALRRVFNRLIDLQKITAGTGEAYWQLAAGILKAKVDPQAEIPKDVREKLGEALEEMIHGLRRQIIGSGVDLDWLKVPTPEPGSAADLNMLLIAAASGYPKRILFGSETGERASTQDERQFNGSVAERQENHAGPNILRPLLDRLVMAGGLTAPAGPYQVVWPNLFEESDEDKANVDKTRAETAKLLSPMAGDPIEDGRAVVDEMGRVKLQPSEGV